MTIFTKMAAFPKKLPFCILIKYSMIKNILLPTDFSTCASFAAKAATMLAQKHGAKLHIISSTIPPEENSATQNYPGDEDAAFKRQIKKTETLLNDLENELKVSHEDIVSKQVYGALIESIRIYCDENDIDLIVMGSHGISGKNEYFIGSNTQK